LTSCSDNSENVENITDLEETTTDGIEEITTETEPVPTEGEIVPYENLAETNIVYKTVADTDGEAKLKLDIDYPTNRIYYNNPTVVAFHGGAWVAGNRSDIIEAFDPLFDKLRANGYTVVTVQYRYASDVIYFPANLEDCIDAILFLAENKDMYNIDTDAVGVMGYSAGAHLAMMCSYAMGTFSSSGNVIDLNYCVSFAGTTKMYEEDAKEYSPAILFMLDALFSGSYDEKPDDYRLGSPYHYLSGDSKTPLILVQGNKDNIVPYSQSEIMLSRATELNIPCELITLEEVTHNIDLNLDMDSPATEEVIDSVEKFIYKYTRKER
jgi:triacylglycerol lipase